MRRLLCAALLLAWLIPVAARASSDLGMVVTSDRFDTVLGEAEMLEIEITNTGATETGPLVAHLVVIDPDSDVSADAEDWTDELTRPVDSLAPGTSTTVLWEVQPISTGEFFVMVVMTPADPSQNAAVSPTMLFSVSGSEASLEASVISVAVVVPIVALAAAWAIRRSERHRLSILAG